MERGDGALLLSEGRQAPGSERPSAVICRRAVHRLSEHGKGALMLAVLEEILPQLT
jgi:hypothetical protein